MPRNKLITGHFWNKDKNKRRSLRRLAAANIKIGYLLKFTSTKRGIVIGIK